MPPKLSRRLVLRGMGGLALGLPLLEGLHAPGAEAQVEGTPPFVVFFRQANGVGAASPEGSGFTEFERFWPTRPGFLAPQVSLQGRALATLEPFRQQLLIVDNVNMAAFDYGDGHPQGVMQLLTAQTPLVPGAFNESEPDGESLDHRIARELNPEGQESLYLYCGTGDVMGGPCLSWRGPGQRRSALHDPYTAYRAMLGMEQPTGELRERLLMRRESVNDVLRAQFSRLLSDPALSSRDQSRLQLHREAIRDVENRLLCRLDEDREAALAGLGAAYESTEGDEVLATARLHLDLAALAISCGSTRVAVLQVGDGFDGSTHYRDPRTGQRMEDYHFVSHRRTSDTTGLGDEIAGAADMQHEIDKQFADTFRHLLETLDAYETPDGGSLLDAGLAVWCSEMGRGPEHLTERCPFILAGSCGGRFRNGEYVVLPGGRGDPTHSRLLNTIGAAVGVTEEDGSPLERFGSPLLPTGRFPQLVNV